MKVEQMRQSHQKKGMRAMTIFPRLMILATTLFLAIGGWPAAAGSLPDCLSAPGIQDLEGFQHRVQIQLGSNFWLLSDPGLLLSDSPGQVGQPQDVPGHCWKEGFPIGNRPRLFGKHFNTGAIAAGSPPRFWSSNAGDHQQLYWVDVLISRWSPTIAVERSNDGYIHYHELVKSGEGCIHPRLVAWMRHTAIERFSFDSGPPRVLPDGRFFRPRNIPHQVMPGIDYSFAPNYDIPYRPESIREGRELFPIEVCEL